MRHRPFAVGACHMYRAETLLGMPQMLHQTHSVGNIGLICRLPYAVIHRQTIEEVFYRFVVGHAACSLD